MYTSLFWKDFFERLVATLVQVFAGLLTADVTGNAVASFAGISWEFYALTLFVAGVAVLAKSLAAAQKSGTVSPASFAPAEPDLPAVAVEEAQRLESVHSDDVAARRIQ